MAGEDQRQGGVPGRESVTRDGYDQAGCSGKSFAAGAQGDRTGEDHTGVSSIREGNADEKTKQRIENRLPLRGRFRIGQQ